MAFLGKKACSLGNNQVFEIIVCIEEGEEKNSLKKPWKQYYLFNTNFLQDFFHSKAEKPTRADINYYRYL